jgi:hypothetical protein
MLLFVVMPGTVFALLEEQKLPAILVVIGNPGLVSPALFDVVNW